jgi:23S rRNA-/tRNA-specific pseudouridylate synthase
MSAHATPSVLHAGPHFFVVDKPAGVPTTSPDGRNCLVELVARLDARAPHHHPSSRLDRDVTGVVIFARTDRAIAHLLAARKAGRYRRDYRAVVTPQPVPARGTWSWPIAVDPRQHRLRVALELGARGERAQDAASEYETLALAGPAALLSVRPITGRTHQIRVHCARAGSPIAGDRDYGGPARLTLPDGRVVAAPRPLLHCHAVEVPALDAEPTRFCAPLPADLTRVWEALGAA